jgi:hypothetical protein
VEKDGTNVAIESGVPEPGDFAFFQETAAAIPLVPAVSFVPSHCMGRALLRRLRFVFSVVG